MLAAYGLMAGLLYGLVMNLWFWPFLTSGVPSGMGFVPGEPVTANLTHYLTFYLATSLGWDLPRGVLTAVLVLVAGRPVLASLRRGTRRAAFGTIGQFVAGHAVAGHAEESEHHCAPRSAPPDDGSRPPTPSAGVFTPIGDDYLIDKPHGDGRST